MPEEDNNNEIGVKATFSLPGGITTLCEFNVSNTEIPTLGEIQQENNQALGSYAYSGKHDQGDLPAPREGGDYALLIGCVSAMKDFSNQYLTDIIKQEKCRREGDPEAIQNNIDHKPTLKKSRSDPQATELR
mmetsp:Transcript_32572/g.49094  ORF Transcript_32572/g.49094 Transcript_32572/m.49094 type:complete len:132 (+) Transcript_32572:98-493(+)